MNTLLLASVIFAGLVVPSAAGPYHAFCKTVWLFGLPCPEIHTRLLQQISAFTPEYMLIATTPDNIQANHTRAGYKQAEQLSFTIKPSAVQGGCLVTGRSASLSFTSLLDDGVNYCNLYNLLSASGLRFAPGFEEMINEWACLSYSLSSCKHA